MGRGWGEAGAGLRKGGGPHQMGTPRSIVQVEVSEVEQIQK